MLFCCFENENYKTLSEVFYHHSQELLNHIHIYIISHQLKKIFLSIVMLDELMLSDVARDTSLIETFES